MTGDALCPLGGGGQELVIGNDPVDYALLVGPLGADVLPEQHQFQEYVGGKLLEEGGTQGVHVSANLWQTEDGAFGGDAEIGPHGHHIEPRPQAVAVDGGYGQLRAVRYTGKQCRHHQG